MSKDFIINKDITLKDGTLYFGTKPVYPSGLYVGDPRVVPVGNIESLDYVKEQPLYGIRVPSSSPHRKRNPYMEWVTGLDILSDGYIWLGTIRLSYDVCDFIPPTIHRNIERLFHILDHLCMETRGEEWIIVEDPQLNLNYTY